MAIDQQTAYARSAKQPRDKVPDSVCFWRERRFDDLECLKARFFRHAYAPHVHDTFAIGVILEGAEAFRYRGVRHVAPAGSLVAVNPDELHDGAPAEDGFAYRMLYPSVALVQAIADELDDRPAGFPAFREAIIDAIESVWSDAGVAVLVDLGGAESNSEMAVEIIGKPRADNVRICNAPIVEGAVMAATEAAKRSDLKVAAE